MISVLLNGGLGNQMFQYAFIKSLSVTSGFKFELNCSLLDDKKARENITKRNYELNTLSLDADVSSPGFFYKIIQKILLSLDINRIREEKSFSFDSTLLDVQDGDFFIGYFQSEKYFSSIRYVLLQEFTPKEISVESISLSSNMSRENSVSVHVRRGDYVSVKAVNEFHGVCALDYYERAISEMLRAVSDPVFYIFSDDMEWVKEKLKIKGKIIFVEHNNGRNSCEDIFLMSCCRHNIIANSSFSWWGAWLNNNRDKKVIAPSKWFNRSDINTGDLLPPSWITL